MAKNSSNTKTKKKGNAKRTWARIGVIFLILLAVFAVSFVGAYIFYKNNKYIPILEKKPAVEANKDTDDTENTNQSSEDNSEDKKE